jgi:formylglycine-generating enzyme required for sulfatase activity
MTSAAHRTTGLLDHYRSVRALTERLAAPLSAEDKTAQSMPDASPTKWHRAHTSWFFEEFILVPFGAHEVFDPQFRFLFNSYYEAVGPRHPRPERGLITRPSAAEVGRYRRHVDEAVVRLIDRSPEDVPAEVLVLGLHHEQQHQELLVMDAKHLLSCHPFGPSMVSRPLEDDPDPRPLTWRAVDGGLTQVGHDVDDRSFAYDNEGRRHTVWIEPFDVAERSVTNADWLEFIADGGYERPELWLSDRWHAVQERGWRGPGYWKRADGQWQVFTTAGVGPPTARTRVSRVILRGRRLRPVGRSSAADGVRVGGGRPGRRKPARPAAGPGSPPPRSGRAHMVGDVWEWTASAYLPYPGFVPVEGALGEYNGKFMCDEHVLRGASCATPAGHERLTYRNFFPAHARWAFSGLRLVRS